MPTFYPDEDFPGPLVTALRALGYDILTVPQDGRAGADAPIVLARAAELGRAVLTKNRDDFHRLHAAMPDHAGIVTITDDNDRAALTAARTRRKGPTTSSRRRCGPRSTRANGRSCTGRRASRSTRRRRARSRRRSSIISATRCSRSIRWESNRQTIWLHPGAKRSCQIAAELVSLREPRDGGACRRRNPLPGR